MTKLGFQFMALIIAGVVGYMLASRSIEALSDEVTKATLELGGTINEAKRLAASAVDLDSDTTKLRERNTMISEELEGIGKSVSRLAKSDPARVGQLLGALERNPDSQAILSKIATLETRVDSIEQLLAMTGRQIKRGSIKFANDFLNGTTVACDEGFVPVGSGWDTDSAAAILIDSHVVLPRSWQFGMKHHQSLAGPSSGEVRVFVICERGSFSSS